MKNYMKGNYFTKNELKRRLNKIGLYTQTEDKQMLNSLYDSALSDSKNQDLLQSEIKDDELKKPILRKRSAETECLIDDDEEEVNDKSITTRHFNFNEVFSKPPGLIKKKIDPKMQSCSFSINNNINLIESGGCLHKSETKSSFPSALLGFGIGAISTSSFYFVPTEKIMNNSNLLLQIKNYILTLSKDGYSHLKTILETIFTFLSNVINKIDSEDIYTLLVIFISAFIILVVIKGIFKLLSDKAQKNKST